MATKYLTKESETFFKALDKLSKGTANEKDLAAALNSIANDFGFSKKGKR